MPLRKSRKKLTVLQVIIATILKRATNPRITDERLVVIFFEKTNIFKDSTSLQQIISELEKVRPVAAKEIRDSISKLFGNISNAVSFLASESTALNDALASDIPDNEAAEILLGYFPIIKNTGGSCKKVIEVFKQKRPDAATQLDCLIMSQMRRF